MITKKQLSFIDRNKKRDKAEIEQLQKDGWRVGVVWECSITGKG